MIFFGLLKQVKIKRNNIHLLYFCTHLDRFLIKTLEKFVNTERNSLQRIQELYI